MPECSKTSLYVLNTVGMVLGIGMLISGLFVQYMPDIKNVFLSVAPTVSQSQVGALSIGLIMIGAFIAFLSSVGCFGARSETKCIMYLYVTSMVILFVGQIAVATFFYIFGRGSFSEEINGNFNNMVHEYQISNQLNKAVVDSIQIHFECCGNTSPDDYARTNSSSQVKELKVPRSCCRNVTTEMEIETLCLNTTLSLTERKGYFYQTGCSDDIVAFINKYSLFASLVCFGITLVLVSKCFFLSS